MMILSFIRYAVAFYGLALEAFYPFDCLPFTISDEMKESLKAQAKDINYFSAVVSLSFLAVFFYFAAIFALIHGSVRLAMRYRPKFRQLVEKRMAEKALKAQNKKKRSRRAVLRGVLFNLLFSVFLIINDVIFNRPEDAATFEQAVTERFDYIVDNAMLIVSVQFLTLSLMMFLGMTFSLVRALVRRRRTSRAPADEESRLAPGEMTEVPTEAQKTYVLEEKLVDISDGIDGIYEKMETYAVSADAETKADNAAEEPLIKL
ncbi:hypothetical protein F5880DRAFT_1546465 [Lentinula raphanica]|nr:hypothetical protein F5880DRAFT_1546465 [Lentinula raphanica]